MTKCMLSRLTCGPGFWTAAGLHHLRDQSDFLEKHRHISARRTRINQARPEGKGKEEEK